MRCKNFANKYKKSASYVSLKLSKLLRVPLLLIISALLLTVIYLIDSNVVNAESVNNENSNTIILQLKDTVKPKKKLFKKVGFIASDLKINEEIRIDQIQTQSVPKELLNIIKEYKTVSIEKITDSSIVNSTLETRLKQVKTLARKTKRTFVKNSLNNYVKQLENLIARQKKQNKKTNSKNGSFYKITFNLNEINQTLSNNNVQSKENKERENKVMQEITGKFSKLPQVITAEENAVVSISKTPNDPRYEELWGLKKYKLI